MALLTCAARLRAGGRSRAPRTGACTWFSPGSRAAGVIAVRPARAAGPGEGLGADYVWVPWVGGQDLVPGLLARSPRPVNVDALHGRSTPRPVAVGAGPHGSPAPVGWFFKDRTGGYMGWASLKGAAAGGIFRGRLGARKCTGAWRDAV